MTTLRDLIPFEYKLKEAAGKPGVLATVEGVFQKADTKNANGRVYPMPLWKNVLAREDTKERLENKQMYGMFGHPASGATDPEKISHVVTKQELRSDGTVWGEADILDTPSGHIVKTLFEYGSKLGISSRGDGSIEKKGGQDEVKEDYRLEAYDFVLKPSTPGAFPGLTEAELTENEKIVAEAIEGLVKSELPEKHRIPVLVESLKILSVLESTNSGDNIKALSEQIQEELGREPIISLTANESVNPLESISRQEESNMAAFMHSPGIPAPQQQPGPQMDPNLLAWHQNQVQAAVNSVAGQKEQEITGLKDVVIRAQREHTETKRKLVAAEALIDDFSEKLKEQQEGVTESEEFVALKERYDASVELLDESLKRLPEIGALRRRNEACEGLLQAGIEKFQEDRINESIQEALGKVHPSLHEKVRPMMEDCSTPEQIERVLEGISATSGGRSTLIEHEPLPGGPQPITEGNQPPVRKPVNENTFHGRLNKRLRNAV